MKKNMKKHSFIKRTVCIILIIGVLQHELTLIVEGLERENVPM